MTGTPLGFVGLGSMGEAMARNLVRAGEELVVWNRTPVKSAALKAEGARVAPSVAELFKRCDTVVVMLANAAATDEVLARGKAEFAALVGGHTLVMTGTFAPSYARELERDVVAAGGAYVEAPVSGSRMPAEDGALVAMTAGEPGAVSDVRAIFEPLCRQVVYCGAVPSGLIMKLAVNVFLISEVSGLVECVHFAERLGVAPDQLLAVLNAGQMASDISRAKLPKLLARDFDVQARITDVLENNRLIVDAAREAGVASPLLDVCFDLFDETSRLGFGDADMVAVVRALEARSARLL